MTVKPMGLDIHLSKNLFLFRLLFLFFLFSAAAANATDPSYRVVRTIAAGGEGGWDYLTVDASARRLYVSRGTRVAVLNADTGAPEGEIPNTQGVHGIALAPDLGRGFTSNGRANTVTIFDPKTLTTLGSVKVPGENPDAILYDPLSHRVFTFNGRTANITAFEGATGSVAGTFAVGGKPEFAVTDLKGRVYVNIEDKNEIVAFDSRTLKVEAHWPLAGCDSPTGLAIDVTGKRLFSGCGNQVLVVLSTGDGRAVAKVPIGKGVDAVVFDPDSNLVFSSNGDGTLTVIHEDSPDAFRLVQSLATKEGARTMALDPKTHAIFLPTARFGPPPPPTAENPRSRRPIVPGSFEILVAAPAAK
jgi:DNA-binding beta-propeller fold protein YncE